MTLRFPNGAHRTVIIGPTGSGKTVAGAFVLSRQDFTKRPWVALDFKGEELWDQLGRPPMRELRLGEMPGKKGLYRMHVNPGQDDALEEWLWKVWKKGNIGLFCDEASLLPQKDAFKAILRQGRSLLIPVIACTQRPVDCDVEIFTESQFRMLFGIEDFYRDYPRIRGLFGNQDVKTLLAERDALAARHEKNLDMRQRWPLWYDAPRKSLTILRPVPPPDSIIGGLKQAVPYSYGFGR